MNPGIVRWLRLGMVVAACNDGRAPATNPDGTSGADAATGQARPVAIAVDDTSVFWVNIAADTLMRVAKSD